MTRQFWCRVEGEAGERDASGPGAEKPPPSRAPGGQKEPVSAERPRVVPRTVGAHPTAQESTGHSGAHQTEQTWRTAASQGNGRVPGRAPERNCRPENPSNRSGEVPVIPSANEINFRYVLVTLGYCQVK